MQATNDGKQIAITASFKEASVIVHALRMYEARLEHDAKESAEESRRLADIIMNPDVQFNEGESE